MAEPEQFELRAVPHLGHWRPVLLQGHNGPCPLIALFNVLSLRGQMKSPTANRLLANRTPRISLLDVVNEVATCLMALADEAANRTVVDRQSSEALAANSVNDILTTLPLLNRGLDLNVRFRKVDDYEATNETAVFDSAGVRILHAWVVDPEKPEAAVMSNKSYNVCLTEMTTHQKPQSAPNAPAEPQPNPVANEESTETQDQDASPPPQPKQEPEQQKPLGEGVAWEQEVMRSWLVEQASQITEYGLSCLRRELKEGELAVFFRSNHYSVITRDRMGRVLQLISDGTLASSLPDKFWESIDDVRGGGQFFGGIPAPLVQARPVTPPVQTPPRPGERRPSQQHQQQHQYHDPNYGTGGGYHNHQRTQRPQQRRKQTDDDCCVVQ